MTLEGPWIERIVALMLGRAIPPADAAALARLLDAREEVLAWLVLRQGALLDDADMLTQWAVQAQNLPRATAARPPAVALNPAQTALDRAAEANLRAIIAANLATTQPADALGALWHNANELNPAGPAYDFRRRIAELMPPAPLEPEQAVIA